MNETAVVVDASLRILEIVLWFVFVMVLVVGSELTARWLERRQR